MAEKDLVSWENLRHSQLLEVPTGSSSIVVAAPERKSRRLSTEAAHMTSFIQFLIQLDSKLGYERPVTSHETMEEWAT